MGRPREQRRDKICESRACCHPNAALFVQPSSQQAVPNRPLDGGLDATSQYSSMAARSNPVIRHKTLIRDSSDSNQSLSDESEDVIFYFDELKNLKRHYSHEKKVHSAPSSHIDAPAGDGHHRTTATTKEDFSQRNLSTLHKEILHSKSERINQLLETGHGNFAHADTRKGQLDDFGYDSISNEEICEWPAILDEANELAGLHGKTCNFFNPSVVPEERRYRKGGRGNSSFKFSFRSLSNKEDFSRDCSLSKDEIDNCCEEDIEGPAKWDLFELGIEEDTVSQFMGNILDESIVLANKPGSVSELLEDMQRTDPSLRRTLAVDDNSKGKERQTSSSKRALFHLGNRVLDNKDTPEFTGDISSEDEHIDQGNQAIQIFKGQTMADLFQEAFNTSAEERAETSRNNKFGFHERLQHVIQLEKNRHMEYLKELHDGRTSSNGLNCITVRILSRTLEAKLTVCQCLFSENNKEGFGNGGAMKKTIIFTPTYCSNVDLEVGNIVCIHPPWKEFQVNGGETIILSVYFSAPL